MITMQPREPEPETEADHEDRDLWQWGTAPRRSLQALHPLHVVPAQLPKHARDVETLRRIERITVSRRVKRQGKTVYSIDIFLRAPHADISSASSSHIPVRTPWLRPHTSRPQAPSAPDRPRDLARLDGHRRDPDLQVERSFADFVRLRSNIARLAHFRHGLASCPFCLSVFYYSAFGEARPRWGSTWFKTQASVCHLLTTFLNDVLLLVARARASGDDLCEGQDLMPVLLSDFLAPTQDRRNSM